ncbi:MAG: hypothetical protein M1820_005837 [Bogoriella megaspora]|nr:MAG: hypothetical protein M1820_005837 [Bogoriella megaspora]
MASSDSSQQSVPLSTILPPLIQGCGVFNTQFVKDPYALDTAGLVHKALQLGVRAFDTSPYYGPSEELLGKALDAPFVHDNFPRNEYFILTKVGRIASSEFDYSPSWIRQSVERSLERLKTEYLDVVYCHDVEFVSPDEAVEAVKELRKIRDEIGKIKYVGISGYPIDVLCTLAERIKDETGQPLDIVLSYANFTIQNSALATKGVHRLKAAGVDVVPNASPLGMGLLRQCGPPMVGEDWHPSPPGLRAAVHQASNFCDSHGERLEVIAIRYALEEWLREGSSVGSRGDPASGVPWERESNKTNLGGHKLGVSVMGASTIPELEKTMQVWRSILDGLENGQETAIRAGRWKKDHEWSLNRRKAVQILTEGIQEVLDNWLDYTWSSPPPGFVNVRDKTSEEAEPAPWLTPAASPEADVPEDIGARERVVALR